MSILRIGNTSCSEKDDHDFEYKNFNKKFTCDGCKQVGSGPRYVCGICGDDFHKSCLYPKNTTSHDFFKESILKFFDKPQKQLCLKKNCPILHERCCDACGMDILGCNYHCAEKRLDLHPMCNNLEKKLGINDTIFELHEGVVSRCFCCKRKKISGSEKNVPGWSYISSCGDIHFHVHCLMEMVHSGVSFSKGEKLEMMKIDLPMMMTSSRRKGKIGTTIWGTVKLFLKAIISVLMGDPTTLLASVVVELIFNAN